MNLIILLVGGLGLWALSRSGQTAPQGEAVNPEPQVSPGREINRTEAATGVEGGQDSGTLAVEADLNPTTSEPKIETQPQTAVETDGKGEAPIGAVDNPIVLPTTTFQSVGGETVITTGPEPAVMTAPPPPSPEPTPVEPVRSYDMTVLGDAPQTVDLMATSMPDPEDATEAAKLWLANYRNVW